MISTQRLPVDPNSPEPEPIRQAAELLKAGEPVAFPTETVYGLGANAWDAEAVGRIFAAKGRPSSNPLIVHVAEPDHDLVDIAESVSPLAKKISARFWPGPLTLVLPKSARLAEAVTAGGPTVAVRCPVHPVARALLQAAQLPLAAPSANRSGELSPTTADHVAASLGGKIPLILDGGPCPGGMESTVVLVQDDQLIVLRPGPISTTMLAEVAGIPCELRPHPLNGVAPSPGMTLKHYAPGTALEVAETAQEADFLANLYETAGLRVARWHPQETPNQTNQILYADLHRLDQGKFDRIIALLPPDEPDWAAVRDRLIRAAAEDE